MDAISIIFLYERVRRVIILLVSLFIFPITFAQTSQQKTNQQLLQFLNCKQTNQVFKKDRLQLGNTVDSCKNKQIFLIQNNSDYPLFLDFPDGHVGASAGLMQMLEPHQWQGYLYVKNHDLWPTIQGKKKRIEWTCYNERHVITSCKTNLFVCEVPYNVRMFQQSNSLVHQKLLMCLEKQNQTGWISDPKDNLLDVFLKGYSVGNQ